LHKEIAKNEIMKTAMNLHLEITKATKSHVWRECIVGSCGTTFVTEEAAIELHPNDYDLMTSKLTHARNRITDEMKALTEKKAEMKAAVKEAGEDKKDAKAKLQEEIIAKKKELTSAETGTRNFFANS
jgi:hypothetical protein